MGFFDAQATARSKREILSNNSINKLGVVSPDIQIGIVRKISDGDTLLLNSDTANTRIAGIDTYETPHDGDWLLNPYNQKRMEKQRMQLSAEVGRPVTNNDVFAKGLEDKQNLLNTLSPASTGNLPILAGVQQTPNQNPTDKSPRNNYGRNLGTVTPLVGNYTTQDGIEVTPDTDTIGMMKLARSNSRSGGGFFKGIDPTRREEYKGSVDGYDVDPINIAKQVAGGIVATASSVSKSPKKLYELLGGNYLEDGSAYAKSVKTIINTMDKGGKYLDKFKDDIISPDNRRVEALQKQVGKAFDEGNYVTGVLGTAIDNPAGVIELAGSMYGFSKAMGAKGLTGAPVIAAAFTDNADQARTIFEKEHGRKPDASETAVIVALSAIGTAVDTAAAKFMFSSAGGDKTATALTATVDRLVSKVPNSVARVALGTGAKVATMMGTEGVQEGLTEATTVLGGTQDIAKAMNDKYLKQVYEAAALGAILGPGMHVINTGEAILPALKEVPGAINTAVDKLRTMEPKLSAVEQREVELAGGTTAPTASTEYKKVLNDTYKEFNTAIQAKDKAAAETHIDTITNTFLEKVQSGELKETDAEYIDTYKKLVDMDIAYNRSKLGNDLKEEAQAIARSYPRMGASKAETPDVLGAKFKLQKAIDMGVILDDVSDADLLSTAKNLGLSEESVQQYIKERGAITTAVEAVKAISKSMSQVEYEATIGEKGFVRYYERMKSAKAKGAKDEYNLASQKLNSFKATQQTKIDAITGWIQDLETNGLTDSNKQVKWKGGVFKILDDNVAKSINGAKKVLNAANMTVEAIDTIMKGKKIIQEKKPTPKAEVKPEPTTKKTETPVEATKTKEVVKDTPKAKEEATEAEKATDEQYEYDIQQEVETEGEYFVAQKGLEHTKLVEKSQRDKLFSNQIIKRIVANLGNVLNRELGVKTYDKSELLIQNPMIGKAVRNDKFPSKTSIEFTQEAIEAAGITMMSWLSQDAESTTMTTPTDIKRMLGISGEVTNEMIDMIGDKGILRKNIIQALGSSVYKQLGIKSIPTDPYNKRSNIEVALGNVLYKAMLDRKLIVEDSSITVKQWNSLSNKQVKEEGADNLKVVMAKLNTGKKEYLERIKQELKEVGKLESTSEYKSYPVYDGVRSKDKHTIRNRESSYVAYKDETGLQAQEKIEHSLKVGVLSVMEELGEEAKTAAGFKDIVSIRRTTHVTKIKSIIANNNAIIRSLDAMQEHASNVEGTYTYNYFMSADGRDMIDSNTFNPQSDKIHRHVEYAGEEVEVDPTTDNDTHEVFKIAVMQGLGVKVEKKTKDQMKTEWESLMHNEDAIKYAKQTISGIKNKKEFAEYAGSKAKIHTIDALVALGKYLEAVENKTTFKNDLQVEVDAVTSGWILALLGLPMFDMVTNAGFLAKGGFYINMPTASYQERAGTELDSYEELADTIKTVMEVTPIDREVGVLLEVNRDFAKPPLMTHIVYGASVRGVREDIVSQYVENLYDLMAKSPEGFKQAQIVVKKLTGFTIVLRQGEYRTSYILPQKVLDTSKSKIDNSYGESTATALSQLYSKFTDVRNLINKAFEKMFDRYAAEYTKGMIELRKKDVITNADIKRLTKHLEQFIPTIKSPNGTDIRIYDSEKAEATIREDFTVQTGFWESTATAITTTADTKRMVAARAAGGVNPIHFIDGVIMREVMIRFKMTGVYDAGIFSITDMKEGTELYNKILVEVLEEYSFLEQVIEASIKYGASPALIEELQQKNVIADKNRKEIFSSDLNVQHFAMDEIRYDKKGTNTTSYARTSVSQEKLDTLIIAEIKAAKNITKDKQVSSSEEGLNVFNKSYSNPKQVWVQRLSEGQVKGFIDKTMTHIKNFGNPFVVKGVAAKGIDMAVAKDAVEASLMYYKWIDKNIIPKGYDTELVKQLNERREFVVNNLDRVNTADALVYWRVPDNKVTHVDALVAIAKKEITEIEVKSTSLEELKKADKNKHDAIMSVIEKFKDCK